MLFFHPYIYIGNNHASWLSYFSERWLNHQPLYNSWWSHFLRGGGCPAHAARSGGAAGVEDLGELHQLVSRNQLIRILKTMVISRVFTCYISYILRHPKGKIMSWLGHIILYISQKLRTPVFLMVHIPVVMRDPGTMKSYWNNQDWWRLGIPFFFSESAILWGPQNMGYKVYPICSVYGIFTYIWAILGVNVVK